MHDYSDSATRFSEAKRSPSVAQCNNLSKIYKNMWMADIFCGRSWRRLAWWRSIDRRSEFLLIGTVLFNFENFPVNVIHGTRVSLFSNISKFHVFGATWNFLLLYHLVSSGLQRAYYCGRLGRSWHAEWIDRFIDPEKLNSWKWMAFYWTLSNIL